MPREPLAPKPGRWLWTCRAGFEAHLFEELAWARADPRMIGESLVESGAVRREPAFARMGFPVSRVLRAAPEEIARELERARGARALHLQAWAPDADCYQPLHGLGTVLGEKVADRLGGGRPAQEHRSGRSEQGEHGAERNQHEDARQQRSDRHEERQPRDARDDRTHDGDARDLRTHDRAERGDPTHDRADHGDPTHDRADRGDPTHDRADPGDRALERSEHGDPRPSPRPSPGGRGEGPPVLGSAELARQQGGLLGQICLLAKDTAAVGVINAAEALSLGPGGRRRMWRESDISRAALKLEEALELFGFAPARGERCADLGAAPGGWTQRLLARGARVLAVDPAKLSPELARHPKLTHVQDSAFAYSPEEPLDWLFCDMAWRPLEVAQLLGKWARRGWADYLIANLKLPMKDKNPTLLRARATLEEAGWKELRIRQLYHDRDEVTVLGRRR